MEMLDKLNICDLYLIDNSLLKTRYTSGEEKT